VVRVGVRFHHLDDCSNLGSGRLVSSSTTLRDGEVFLRITLRDVIEPENLKSR